MKTVTFSIEEIELAQKIHEKGILWRPKSSDWFVDLNNLRVLYTGEYEQSISLCLVLDEDGRSFSYLELLIDGEENGNRMKKSMSYSRHDELSNIVWLPSIKDCIDIINRIEDYEFVSLEKNINLYKVIIKNLNTNKTDYYESQTELLAFYNAIIHL